MGLGQLRSGPGKAGVAIERGRFMAKATKGPAPRLQLLHGYQTWLKPQLCRIHLKVAGRKKKEDKRKFSFLDLWFLYSRLESLGLGCNCDFEDLS